MRFSVNKKELSDVLNNLLRAISNKSSIPALEGILIKSQNNQIELTAYDLEIGMKTFVSANIIEEGKIVLTAKLFSEIIRKAPADKINISVDEKSIAFIESGNANFTIVGIKADEFPELPNVGSEESLIIPSEILKSMIKQTIFAVAENDSKPINQGSLFNISNGVLDVVSVDGYRLATRRENIKSDMNNYFVVPGKALSEVLKISSEQDIEIIPGRRHIMFKMGSYILVSSVLEGEFIDYKNTIPSQFNTIVTIKTKDLIESTERVSLLITDRLKSPVRCSFTEDKISLSCTTALGKASDDFICNIEGPAIEMGFNNKYLLDALKYSECDEVLLKITGAINPMVICPVLGDSFTFLVLPVRLRN